MWDLKRPERFLFLFLKSNFSSWLVLGGYVLTLFTGGSALWILAAVLDLQWALTTLAWLAIPVSALMAGYTAFLFGQAEGRDLWQSPVLFWHLQAQAVMVGSGALAVFGLFFGLSDAAWALIIGAFVIATIAHLAILLVEYGGRHVSRQAATAAHVITHGRYARTFWLGSVLPTVVAALLGVVAWATGMTGAGVVVAVAGLIVQPALLAYESVFVRAGQDMPLS